MKWILVAFNHPDESKSILYRQGLTEKGLHASIATAIAKGANLFSIRGFEEVP